MAKSSAPTAGPVEPRIDADEARKVLSQLDLAPAPANPKYKRKMRIPYNSRNILMQFEEGLGGKAVFPVQGRNISVAGIAVIHTQFVHSGRRCIMMLPTVDGGARVDVLGKVSRCRHVTGRIHEVVIVFDAPIDVTDFIRLSENEERKFRAELESVRSAVVGSAASQPVRGKALLVEGFEGSRQLYGFWLKKLGMDVLEAESVAKAEQQLASSPVDLVITDHQIEQDGDGLDLIKKLRAAHTQTPVICIASDSSTERRAAVLSAGFNEFLPKPFERDEFDQAVRSLVSEDPYGAGQTGPIRSNLAEQKDMVPLLQKFVEQVKSLSDMLKKAIDANDLPNTARICQRLTETGSGYGFTPVSDVGKRTVAAIKEETACGPRVKKEVDRLLGILSRLTV